VATFAEAAAYLGMIAKRAEDAAEPVAIAMAEAFTDHVSKVTLRQYAHDRWSKTPAPKDGPPAMVSGHLADSFVVIPGGSAGGVGRAVAGNTAIYAAVQEFGAVITVKTRRYLMWRTSYVTDATSLWKSEREGDGLFLNFAKSVSIPARPYFDVKGAIPEIEEKKIAVFMARVWGA
jgi:phage gpG-like protein